MHTATAPDRSYVQRIDALQKANEIRTRRARLKEQLYRGEVRVEDLLLDPPGFVDTMKVFNLLVAAPKFGRVKVGKLLSRSGISPSKTVGGLTERQRQDLVGMLRG